MSSKSKLLDQQRHWAESIGLAADSRGYLNTVEANLLRQLSDSTRMAFENGSGSELQDTPSRPAKMKALHSSSALAVNFFVGWMERDTSILAEALGLDSEISAIKFEEQFSTGLDGNPPNLDIVLELADGNIVGIESKFSEWLTPKSKSTVPFKPAYFPDGQGLWEARSLPAMQQLVEAIASEEQSFRYLNAPQLLKHALGLATQLSNPYSLFYIYYDSPGKESETHYEEIQHFGSLVDSSLRFKAVSYQDLFSSLRNKGSVEEGYMNYMRARYFNEVV